ncbi:MAG: vWA domain-containing protein [Bacteroidota bacterium]
MKHHLLTLMILSLFGMQVHAQVQTGNRWGDDYASDNNYDNYDPYQEDYDYPREYSHTIQIALILDVSGSMDGLIDQAKSEIWNIVNGIMYDEQMGGYPNIELALLQYGSNRLSSRSEYLEVVVPFTNNLDWIADELFALRTGGNREYAPSAVNTALNQLRWTYNPRDLRLIYIAGNENFQQGRMSYRNVSRTAQQFDVVVNTIFCGDYYQGQRMGWEQAAFQTRGDYLNINQNYRPTYYDGGYGQQLYSLNIQLNNTYIPYGRRGAICYTRQRNLDRWARDYGWGYASQRYIAKATYVYRCPEWDLVDAVASGRTNLRDIPSNDLPANMQKMTLDQRRIYVQEQMRQRQQIQNEMRKLGKRQIKAAAVHSNQNLNKGGNGRSNQTLDKAILNSTRHQQAVKNGAAPSKAPVSKNGYLQSTPSRSNTGRPNVNTGNRNTSSGSVSKRPTRTATRSNSSSYNGSKSKSNTVTSRPSTSYGKPSRSSSNRSVSSKPASSYSKPARSNSSRNVSSSRSTSTYNKPARTSSSNRSTTSSSSRSSYSTQKKSSVSSRPSRSSASSSKSRSTTSSPSRSSYNSSRKSNNVSSKPSRSSASSSKSRTTSSRPSRSSYNTSKKSSSSSVRSSSSSSRTTKSSASSRPSRSSVNKARSSSSRSSIQRKN